MTTNLSDARLLVHQRITDILIGLFTDGADYTDDDADTAADIADELMNGLGLAIVDSDNGAVLVSIPIS